MVITRRAERTDIPAIVEVLSKAVARKQSYNDSSWGTDPFTFDEVLEIFEKSRVYVATVNGVIIGTVSVTNTDELWDDIEQDGLAWYVHRLAALDGHKGQNIGGQLLDKLIEDARRHYVSYLRLDFATENTGLARYYKKQGFEEIIKKQLHNKISNQIDRVSLWQKKIS